MDSFVVVIAENCGIGYRSLNQGSCDLEDCCLGVRSCRAFNLVAGQDNKVGLFIVQNGLDELHGPSIGVALSAWQVARANGIPTHSQTCRQVRI